MLQNLKPVDLKSLGFKISKLVEYMGITKASMHNSTTKGTHLYRS